jgi:hypothetical protein
MGIQNVVVIQHLKFNIQNNHCNERCMVPLLELALTGMPPLLSVPSTLSLSCLPLKLVSEFVLILSADNRRSMFAFLGSSR